MLIAISFTLRTHFLFLIWAGCKTETEINICSLNILKPTIFDLKMMVKERHTHTRERKRERFIQLAGHNRTETEQQKVCSNVWFKCEHKKQWIENCVRTKGIALIIPFGNHVNDLVAIKSMSPVFVSLFFFSRPILWFLHLFFLIHALLLFCCFDDVFSSLHSFSLHAECFLAYAISFYFVVTFIFVICPFHLIATRKVFLLKHLSIIQRHRAHSPESE